MLKKKTLLILTNNYPCKEWEVAGTFVKSQVNELKKHFKKIIVLSQNPYFPRILGKMNIFPNLFQNYSKPRNYKYDNVEVYYIRYITPFKDILNLRGKLLHKAISKFIKKHNLFFDIIHAHFTYPSGYVATLLKKEFNKKAVITIHENKDLFISEEKSKDPKIINTWKNADLLIRVNKKDLDILRKYNKNSIFLPNGYTSKNFKKIPQNVARKHLSLPIEKKILLNLATFRIHHKNQLTLIKAIKELIKIRKDFILYLIGIGEDENKIKQSIKKEELDPFVKILHHQPRANIPIWMNAADLFVLPSYSEGNPTVMFETLGCATPFIGTKVGGIPEVITSKDYGLLIEDPEDFKALAKTLDFALNKKWNYSKIKEYSKEFTWKNICTLLIKKYECLIKNGDKNS